MELNSGFSYRIFFVDTGKFLSEQLAEERSPAEHQQEFEQSLTPADRKMLEGMRISL